MPRSEAAAVLAAHPVFAVVPPREIDALAAVVREDTHRPREYIFLEGDPALWLCVVKSGHVKILKHSRTGRDVVLEFLGPGEVFGGVAVIERRPYPASAQATETSVILKIPADAVVALVERYPAVIREMALMIGRRLRRAHDSVRALAVEPVEARLATVLLGLAEREGTATPRGIMLPFHLTRQSLADMSGTTVETAIRVVSRWMRAGLVVDEGGRLVVCDAAALRARCEGGGG
jgi:CRP/FNR family transcriptional regulator